MTEGKKTRLPRCFAARNDRKEEWIPDYSGMTKVTEPLPPKRGKGLFFAGGMSRIALYYAFILRACRNSSNIV